MASEGTVIPNQLWCTAIFAYLDKDQCVFVPSKNSLYIFNLLRNFLCSSAILTQNLYVIHQCYVMCSGINYILNEVFIAERVSQVSENRFTRIV